MTIALPLPLGGLPLATLLDALRGGWQVVDDEAGRPMFSRGEGAAAIWEYVPHPRAADYNRRSCEVVQAIVSTLTPAVALAFLGELYAGLGQAETPASIALAERVARAWGLSWP